MKAVVLAAGRGARLGPLTEACAKPLMPILNRPLLGRVLQQLAAVGVRQAYLNLHYLHEQLEAFLGQLQIPGLEVVTRVEPKLTGPAGGARTFLDLIEREPFVLVASADACHQVPLERLVAFHQRRRATISVVSKAVSGAERFGVMKVADDGRILEFAEKPKLEPNSSGLVSCGIYCVDPSVLRLVPSDRPYDFGADLLPQLAREGAAAFAYETSAFWTDVGSPAELGAANRWALSSRAFGAPAGVELRPGVFVEAGAELEAGVSLEGPIAIGAGARIAAGSLVRGPAVIGAGVHLGRGCHVEDALILDLAAVPAGGVVLGGIYARRGEDTRDA